MDVVADVNTFLLSLFGMLKMSSRDQKMVCSPPFNMQ
jgi:hypothetical protein